VTLIGGQVKKCERAVLDGNIFSGDCGIRNPLLDIFLTTGWRLSKMTRRRQIKLVTGSMLKARKPRNSRQVRDSSNGMLIPDKLYFRIGEVSELANTKPYVLRYWETEFPSLKPTKSATGHRLYRRPDVEMVLQIRRLLYQEGFTIEGARKYLAGKSESVVESKPASSSKLSDTQINAIKRELRGILTIVSR
jgi:DNA-binding transcriptional MerR regulator